MLKVVLIFVGCLIRCRAANKCALYENPGVLNCFNGAEVVEKLTNSDNCWAVEFYSNWCGHCQHFASTWKQIAYDVEGWKSFLQLGIVNCAESRNSDVCRQFKVMAYPTIKLFPPHMADPISSGGQDFKGSRSPEAITKQFVEFVFQQSFQLPLVREIRLRDFLELKKASSSLAVLFEAENGDNGRVLSLDLASALHDTHMTIYVASSSERVFANHLSISTLPSLVLINSRDTRVYNKETLGSDNLRKGFLEAMQQWIPKLSVTTKTVDIASPSNHQHQQANGEMVGMIAEEKNVWHNKTGVIPMLPSKPHLIDLQSAVAYTFRQEVSLHSIVSGEAFNSLLQFSQLLEQVFSVLDPPTNKVLRSINFQLRSRKGAGFMLARDWLKLLDAKLDPSMAILPVKPRWESCAGSKPQYRGYPCGLWSLLHTLVTHCFPAVHVSSKMVARPMYRSWQTNSFGALKIVKGYVENFFTCERCRQHFSHMAAHLDVAVLDDVSAILWLWRAHNSVTKRIANDITADPAHPKTQFPNQQLCKTCSITSANGSINWNYTAVLFYLFDFYSMEKIDVNELQSRTSVRSQMIVSIHSQSDRRYHAPSFSIADVSSCVMVYLLMAITLAAFFLHLYYNKRRRKPAKFIV